MQAKASIAGVAACAPEGNPSEPDPESLAGDKTFDEGPAAADPAADPTAMRAEAMAHARAVVEFCRLAGQPQMAGRFLEQEASLDEVRTALLAAQAEPEIIPHHPQPGPVTSARPWGDVIARTFRTKG